MPSRGFKGHLRARMRPACRKRVMARGASALEFALVAPLVVLVLFVSIELGIIMMADATLGAAASRVSRIGQLGVPEGTTCETAVRGTFAQTMRHWVYDSGDLNVDARVYRPGNINDLPDLDDEKYEPVCDTGGRGDMVIYRLGFDHPGFSGIMTLLGIKVLRFERTVIIQNEPA